jgi:TldD protein
MKIEDIVSYGVSNGADFVDVFKEETRRSSVSYRDSKVESASANIDFGFGIRLIYGKKVLYVQTNHEEENKIKSLMDDLIVAHDVKSNPTNKFNQLTEQKFNDEHPCTKLPSEQGQAVKLKWLKNVDKIARAVSPKISQVSATAMDETSNVTIANSDGLLISDKRTRSRFLISTIASDKNNIFTGSESPGSFQGYEFFDELDYEMLTKKAANRALLMLEAGYIKGGVQPVVMGNGFGGVIFHEACGHPLETEAIRRNSSPFVGKLNKKIAADCLTAIDDGTIINAWGSINIDDEGMTTQKTTLIKNGILKNYLSDKIGAEEVGVNRTGSARRESFRYAPVSRMRNTYIAAGNDDFEAMIGSVEDGLYAKVMGGGSVNPATGEFNFSVQEGYHIKNGQIKEPVRGATLIGKGHEIIKNISMVGKDLEFAAGICGASSGSVPTTVGQPTLKVDEIQVGGES